MAHPVSHCPLPSFFMFRVPEVKSDCYWARESWAMYTRLAAVWLGFWNSDHVVLKSSIRSSASPHLVAVWLGFWNSDHLVLQSNVRTLALPRRQQSHWGLRVTQDAYFSLLRHTKQLLLVTFCDTPAELELVFGWMENGQQGGGTDRQTWKLK